MPLRRLVGLVLTAALLALATPTAAMAQSAEGFTITSSIRSSTGAPVAGVSVDLFEAISQTERGNWISDTQSGNDGSISFSGLAEGCYILTFVAPADRTLNGGRAYVNTASQCFAEGDETTKAVAPVTVLSLSEVGSITGAVKPAAGGTAIQDISIGVFEANSDGTRGSWLRDTETVNGQYNVRLIPGCYVLTYVASSGSGLIGFRFSDGSVFFSTAKLCLAGGETVAVADVTMVPRTELGAVGAIYYASAIGFRHDPHLPASLFKANSDGSRGAWIRDFSATTVVPPGCYIVTFTAPAGMVSEVTGTAYENQKVCTVALGDATVFAGFGRPAESVTISGTVRAANGAAVPQVSVGVFLTSYGGIFPRLRWVRDVTTGPDGTYTFTNLSPACHTVTFVAPPGRTFTNGSIYFTNIAPCTRSEFDGPNSSASGVDATLS